LGHQQIVKTGMICKLLPGTHGKIIGPWNKLLIEPWVAPGILLDQDEEIFILISNLNQEDIKIGRNQVLGFLHIEANEEVAEIHEFGDFEDMGLPVIRDSTICSIIPREKLEGLTQEQQNQVINLFEKYKCIFAENNEDLGCAKGVVHTIDTEGKGPI
jgi:hypothetical protein